MAGTPAPRIIIVDDEEALRFFIADGLVQAGWDVDEADSGETALEMFEHKTYDLMLLDLRMAGMDGLAVMRQVKERWPNTMIIIMTAYASIDSAIEAVRQGAFDYLRKPCSVSDIIACANRALDKKQTLNRQQQPAGQDKPAGAAVKAATRIVRTGELTIDLGSRAASLTGLSVALTPTEFGLLEILAESPGRPVPLARLIQDGLGYDPTDLQAQETLRVHISRLRRKLSPRYILTVRGGGYALADMPPAP